MEGAPLMTFVTGHHGHGKGGGKSGQEMRDELQALHDQTLTRTSCAFCSWAYEGTAVEGRELAKGHRRVAHPEIKPVRRKRGSLAKFVGRQPDWQKEGLERAAGVAEMIARRERTA